jgi:DNA-binding CsgD family transcriptional regulator
MSRSTISRAEAQFKQLACLGLGSEAIMPALIRELHAIVPFATAAFFYNRPDGQLDHIYTERPVQSALYVEMFHDARDHEIPGWGWRDWSQTERGAHDLEDILTLDKHAFHMTDFYNLVYRPSGTDRLLRLVVRDHGNVVGSASLYRGGDRQWTSEDKRRLEALELFFAHALRHRTDIDTALTDSGDEGLIIADTGGHPLHMSREGERLFYMAMLPRIGPGVDFGRARALPRPLARICRDLAGIFAGQPDVTAPVYRHRNHWGGFVFRAHWLGDADPVEGHIAISIRHDEPVQVKLLRRAGELPLSRRQAEVAFHLATGASHEGIAERLGISRNTAIAHGRWIYNKLDVHNRAELVGKLLAN